MVVAAYLQSQLCTGARHEHAHNWNRSWWLLLLLLWPGCLLRNQGFSWANLKRGVQSKGADDDRANSHTECWREIQILKAVALEWRLLDCSPSAWLRRLMASSLARRPIRSAHLDRGTRRQRCCATDSFAINGRRWFRRSLHVLASYTRLTSAPVCESNRGASVGPRKRMEKIQLVMRPWYNVCLCSIALCNWCHRAINLLIIDGACFASSLSNEIEICFHDESSTTLIGSSGGGGKYLNLNVSGRWFKAVQCELKPLTNLQSDSWLALVWRRLHVFSWRVGHKIIAAALLLGLGELL